MKTLEINKEDLKPIWHLIRIWTKHRIVNKNDFIPAWGQTQRQVLGQVWNQLRDQVEGVKQIHENIGDQ